MGIGTQAVGILTGHVARHGLRLCGGRSQDRRKNWTRRSGTRAQRLECREKAKESLTAFSKNRQALIEIEEKELRRMEEDFIKQASVLSPAAKNEREQVFRRRMAEYQQKAAELNREVQEKQKDVLEAFRDKVEAIVAKVAKRNGLQVVIDKGKGGPAIFGAEELDLTNQVIEEFNREYP